MKNYYIYGVILVEVLLAIVGFVEDFSDEKLQFLNLPKGIGVMLSMIAVTMLAFLIKTVQEARERAHGWQEIRSDFDYLKILAQKGGYCAAVHEKEFYFLWKKQFEEGQNNIDITHMGKVPPRNLNSQEIEYFNNYVLMTKATTANTRRVERLTKEKITWIDNLHSSLKGCNGFSLSVVIDTSEIMPISVSRIDDKYAWIVALSQGESTINFRDILITDKNVISILSNYFENNLWKKSVLLLNRGQSTGNWEEIKRRLDAGIDIKEIKNFLYS